MVVLGNSFGCQVAVELAVRHPEHVRGLVLVGPTMDPAARTTSRQILRWLRDTAREDPLQLPILLRDIYDAGLHRVIGTLAHALRDPIEDKLPLVRVPVLVTRGELAVVPGPHNANYGAAHHLGALVRDFLRQRVQAQGGQAS